MRNVVVRLALAILLIPGISSAAGEEKNVVLAVTKAARTLAKSTNIILSRFSSRLIDLSNRSKELDAAKALLTSDLAAANDTHKTNKSALDAAIYKRTTLEGLQEILFDLVEFHVGLIGTADRFVAHVTDCSSNPDLCLNGKFYFRRLALETIILSQQKDVQTISEIINAGADRLKKQSDEHDELFLRRNLQNIRFGVEPYYNSTKETLPLIREMYDRMPQFYDGITAGNVNTDLLRPCYLYNPPRLPTLLEELREMSAAANSAANFNSWKTTGVVKELIDRYDGTQYQPGIISHWGGCINSYALQIGTSAQALINAEQRGDTLAARNHWLDIRYLSTVKFVLEQELKLVRHRREQIDKVIRAADLQDDVNNVADAWRTTVRGHAEDIIEAMPAYRRAFRAGRNILDNIIDYHNALNQFVNNQDTFLDRNGAFSSNQRALILGGFDRLIADLLLTKVALGNLAAAGATGESALVANIQVYKGAISQLRSDADADVQTLPGNIAATQSAVTNAQANFDSSAEFIHVAQQKFDDAKALRIRFDDTYKQLDLLIARQKFSPVYAGVLQNFRAPLTLQSFHSRIKIDIDKILNGIVQNPASALIGKSPAPGKVRSPAARKFISAVKFSQKRVNRLLALIVSEVTRSLLNGADIEDSFNSLELDSQGILNLR